MTVQRNFATCAAGVSLLILAACGAVHQSTSSGQSPAAQGCTDSHGDAWWRCLNADCSARRFRNGRAQLHPIGRSFWCFPGVGELVRHLVSNRLCAPAPAPSKSAILPCLPGFVRGAAYRRQASRGACKLQCGGWYTSENPSRVRSGQLNYRTPSGTNSVRQYTFGDPVPRRLA
jgi:hypothetical protein